MPPTTKIVKFIKALKSNKTDSTEAMEKLFDTYTTPDDVRNIPGLMARLNTPGALEESIQTKDNKPLKKALKFCGMHKREEFDHIDDWPDGEWHQTNNPTSHDYGKEAIRSLLHFAFNNDKTIKFRWDLTDNSEEEIIADPPLTLQAGDELGFIGNEVKITFMNPRKNLVTENDEVTVVVGG